MAEQSPTATPPPAGDDPAFRSQPAPPGAQMRSGTELLKIAVERGYVTPVDAQKFVDDHSRGGGNTSTIVPDLLVQKGLLKQEQARAIERALRGASMIAGFEIMEKIGQGGMGAVFRAKQVSMDRIVALKILPPKLAKDPIFKQRFMSEAKMCAKLSHLNIINGIDCGDDKGYTYFAMEFVDGRTLKQILKEKGKFPLDEGFPIMRQTVEALCYAKRVGLVHRDIKPDNIMLTKQGVAKLCDLGLAKQMERAEDAHLTQSGQAVGTPHYISPEQARGASVDFRSDIYSLGCTFYHMLTGKTPFTGATSASIMALHLTSDAPNPCDIEAGLPLSYGQIIAKMMAKDIADRYASPEELMEDLDSAKNSRVTTAATFTAKSTCRPPTATLSAKVRGRTTGPVNAISGEIARVTGRHLPQLRRSPLVGALLALAFIGIAGGTGYFVVTRMAPQEQDMAQLPPKPAPPGPALPPKVPQVPQIEDPEKINTRPDTEKPPVPTPATTTEVKPAVNPATTEVKTPAPQPIKTPAPPDQTQTPAPPPPPQPDETKQPIPVEPATPAVVKPPMPVLKLSVDANAPDVVHARFLREMVTRATKSELQKLRSEMYDLAQQKEYKPASDAIKKDLEDLDGALAVEKEAIKTFGTMAGKEISLHDEAKVMGAKKCKIVSADLGRMGLIVEVSMEGRTAQTFLTTRSMNVDEVANAVAGTPVLKRAQYVAARTYLKGVLLKLIKLLPELSEADQKRWEYKIRLLSASETDLLGEQAFAQLAKVAEAKDWASFESMLADFDKYKDSKVVEENGKRMEEWKAASKAATSTINILKRLLHAAEFKDLGNDFVEVTYDFSTKEQLLDFEGKVELEEGRMVVQQAQGDLTTARYKPAALALKELRCVGRLVATSSQTRLNVILTPAGAAPSENQPMLVFRHASGKAFLENMATRKPVASTTTYSWHQDVEIYAKESGPRVLEWYVNGQLLGPATLPDSGRAVQVTLAALAHPHSWKAFKVVFKPDPTWVKAQAASAK